jgi:hypothetical protein
VTTVQDDPAYKVLSADELLIRQGRGRDTVYVRCASSVMAEIADAETSDKAFADVPAKR